MSAWQTIGKQRICVTDDLIEIEISGEFVPAELLQGLALVEATQGRFGYALLLIVLKDPWSFPAATRQALAGYHRQHKVVGVTAVVGASSVMRILIDLVLRAIDRVVGAVPTTRFFSTRPEALSWLGEIRGQAQQGRLGR
ncbi:MAG TPA: hypothetical protein PKI03_16320 [Pseudomonadota bacterium]|nr:hypothetical protein [Pseudomonadota bacterium]